jgi:hypothetical protein
MDPVTIAAAVLALVGTNAVGGFAAEAGTQAWDALQKILVSVRTRLSPRGARALASAEAGAAESSDTKILTDEIQALAESDTEFRVNLAGLLTLAEQSKPLAAVIAIARDNARQINIGGNNSGAIDMGKP